LLTLASPASPGEATARANDADRSADQGLHGRERADQNEQLEDDADRTIAETRQYLDDADELLRTENTAVDFFNAKVERYPNHLGRTVLWAGASTLYGVREHPDEDIGQIILTSWL
jgi:hypothetical protein